MPRRRKTPAERARALHDRNPTLTPTELAERVGVTRQAVNAALSVTEDRRGRPKLAPTRGVKLSSELLDRAIAAAEVAEVGPREWIEAAIEARLRRS